jgi:hypothetical protein
MAAGDHRMESQSVPLPGQPPSPISADLIRQIAEETRRVILRDLVEIGWAPSREVEIAPRWKGGDLVLKPVNGQEKTVPLEVFFKKIVLARERMRVLEQKINNHPKLDDEERLEIQRYISQIYGSFTTFNVLFAERSDWFVGQKGDRF